jgi:hypothetical protein
MIGVLSTPSICGFTHRLHTTHTQQPTVSTGPTIIMISTMTPAAFRLLPTGVVELEGDGGMRGVTMVHSVPSPHHYSPSSLSPHTSTHSHLPPRSIHYVVTAGQ